MNNPKQNTEQFAIMLLDHALWNLCGKTAEDVLQEEKVGHKPVEKQKLFALQDRFNHA